MRHQRRIAPEIEQWAGRLTAPLHNAWRGRPGREARRTLGKIGFWIAQPCGVPELGHGFDLDFYTGGPMPSPAGRGRQRSGG
jgi:hypothetical protein